MSEVDSTVTRCSVCSTPCQCNYAEKLAAVQQKSAQKKIANKLEKTLQDLYYHQGQVVFADTKGGIIQVDPKDVPADQPVQGLTPLPTKTIVYNGEPVAVEIPVVECKTETVRQRAITQCPQGQEGHYVGQPVLNGKYKHFSKIVSDLQLNFRQNIQAVVYFDIETVRTFGENDVPSHKNIFDHIFSIQFHTAFTSGRMTDTVMINGRDGKYEISKDAQKEITIKWYKTEAQMCDAFFEYLDTLGEVILVGYNSSMSFQMTHCFLDCGYDLPWLLQRCSTKFSTVLQHISFKYLGSCKTIISKIVERPQWHIVDAMRSAADYLVQNSLRPSSLSLKNVAEAMEIQVNKLESDFTLYKKLFSDREGDLTEFVRYGVRDCIVTKHVLEKTQALVIALQQAEDFNLWMSLALHGTTAQKIEAYLLQQYRKQGYMPAYEGRERTVAIEGAYTFKGETFCDKFSGQSDAVSLYPSLLCMLKASPENIVDDSDAKFCEWEGVEGGLCKVGFRGANGILDKEVQRLMDDRVAKKGELKIIKQKMVNASPEELKRLKREYNIVDVQQLAKKVAINGIYGGLAAGTNSLGTWALAACVTAQGRAVIRECKAFVEEKGQTVYNIDTDGIQFSLPEGSTWATLRDLEKAMQDHVQKKFETNKLVFEHEEVILPGAFTITKKSYVQPQIVQNFQKFSSAGRIQKEGEQYLWVQEDGMSMPIKVKTRGVQLFGLHEEAKELLWKMVVDDILFGRMAPGAAFLELQKEVKKRIYEAINKRDKQLLSPWAKSLKNTSKNLMAQAVRHNYPEMENESVWKIVYLYGGSKKVSDKIIPLDCVSPNDWAFLDVDAIAKDLISRASKVVRGLVCNDVMKGLLKTPFTEEYEENLLEKNDDEILVRVVSNKGKQSTERVPIERIGEFIISKAQLGCEVHEFISDSSGRCRLYFDVDHFGAEPHYLITALREVMQQFAVPEQNNIRMIRNSHKPAFHIFAPVSVELSFAKYLAEAVNENLSEKGLGSQVFDTQVYHSKAQMRMPGSIRRDKEGLYPMPSKARDGDITEYLCSYTESLEEYQTPLNLRTHCMLDEEYLMGSSQIEEEQFKKFQKWAKGKALTGKLTPNYRGACFEQNGPFDCPVCSRTHTKSNLYLRQNRNKQVVIDCFRRDERGGVPILLGEEQEENVVQKLEQAVCKTIAPMKQSRVQSHRYLRLDKLPQGLTFIKAPLGSGKTKCLADIRKDFGACVILSNRISLSNSLLGRYEGAKSYQMIDGRINTKEHPTVIVQVEAIGRLSGEIDLLIVDEVESIITQLNSSHSSESVLHKFEEILRNSRNVVCMDGFLQQRTVDLIAEKRKSLYSIVHNISRPYEGVPLEIKISNKAKDYLAYANTLFQEHKRVVVHCGNRDDSETLKQYAVALGKPCEVLNGDNLAIVEKGDRRMTHSQEKRELVQGGLDELAGSHEEFVIIYTGSVTCGLDLQAGVDLVLGLCTGANKTHDAFSFVQGMLRARKHQRMIAVLPEHGVGSIVSPYDQTNTLYRGVMLKHHEQWKTMLESRRACMNALQPYIIVRQLSSLGYDTTVSMLVQEEKKQREKAPSGEIKYVPLSAADMEIISKINDGQITDPDTVVEFNERRRWAQALAEAGYAGNQQNITHEYLQRIKEHFGTDTIEDAIINHKEALRWVLRKHMTTQQIVSDVETRKKGGAHAAVNKMSKGIVSNELANKISAVAPLLDIPLERQFTLTEFKEKINQTDPGLFQQLNKQWHKIFGMRGLTLQEVGRTKAGKQYVAKVWTLGLE